MTAIMRLPFSLQDARSTGNLTDGALTDDEQSTPKTPPPPRQPLPFPEKRFNFFANDTTSFAVSTPEA